MRMHKDRQHDNVHQYYRCMKGHCHSLYQYRKGICAKAGQKKQRHAEMRHGQYPHKTASAFAQSAALLLDVSDANFLFFTFVT